MKNQTEKCGKKNTRMINGLIKYITGRQLGDWRPPFVSVIDFQNIVNVPPHSTKSALKDRFPHSTSILLHRLPLSC